MIKMIHRDTGVEMWVHESNVKDFMARGHKVASALSPKPEKKPAPKKKK